MHKASLLLTISLFFASIPLANAHGYVQSITIGGQKHSGWLPFTDPYSPATPERIVRQVPNDGPILDKSDPNLTCHIGGDVPSTLTADVNAGAVITYQWNTWPVDHKGTVMVHLAFCGNEKTSCDAVNKPATLDWFPIIKDGFSDGAWATDRLISAGATYTFEIPKNLAPGAYIMRHELLALHSTGAPQFYPSCSQIFVSGSGSGKPLSEETERIPGIYDGYRFPNIWAGEGPGYEVAGKGLPTFVRDSHSSGDHGVGSTEQTHSTAFNIMPMATAGNNTATRSLSHQPPIPTSTGPQELQPPRCLRRRRRRRSKRSVNAKQEGPEDGLLRRFIPVYHRKARTHNFAPLK